MLKEKALFRNPWVIVPTLYFAQGIPFVLVNQLSVAMFKSLNVSNAMIGITSIFYIPWAIKFLWGPLVDGKSTKRSWLLWMQFILGTSFLVFGLFLQLPYFFVSSIVLFIIIAFVSATHDIAIDGFYLYALDAKQQALFVGIRSGFYRIAMIFAGGLLVSVAGIIAGISSVKFGWTVGFLISAIIFFLLFAYHKFLLPYPANDVPVRANKSTLPFKEIFIEYFSQEKIGIVLLFILLYRFGEGLLLKMAQPFLLDKISVGGLGLSLAEVGVSYGTFGVIALIGGGIFGGWLIKKINLKNLIWPLAFCIHLPNLLYVYLSYFRPVHIVSLNLQQFLFSNHPISVDFHPIVLTCIIIEQFGYGLGFSSFMVYLLYISKGKYKTSHYAISTGLMAIGMMVPGFISGMLQQAVGYLWLFVLSVLTTIPGFVTIFFLPLKSIEEKN